MDIEVTENIEQESKSNKRNWKHGYVLDTDKLLSDLRNDGFYYLYFYSPAFWAVYINEELYRAILTNAQNVVNYCTFETRERLLAELHRLYTFFKGCNSQIANDVIEVMMLVSCVQIGTQTPTKELDFEAIIKNS
ncbi:MAG: hypothetical protein WCE81_08865 [Halobacteriota archaeon]